MRRPQNLKPSPTVFAIFKLWPSQYIWTLPPKQRCMYFLKADSYWCQLLLKSYTKKCTLQCGKWWAITGCDHVHCSTRKRWFPKGGSQHWKQRLKAISNSLPSMVLNIVLTPQPTEHSKCNLILTGIWALFYMHMH